MRLVTVLNGVGSIGMFSSRAFVTAFAVAATLRWGPKFSWINDLGLLSQVTDVPTWFTHNTTLWILGVLAALEIAATKSPEARAVLNEVDGYIKSGMAFVTYFAVAGVVNANDAAIINQITAALPTPMQAGIGDIFDFMLAGATAIGVWFTALARARLVGTFIEADPDDDTMVQGLFSWAEDVFSIFGTLLLILYPPFMLVVTGLIMGGLWLMEWRARRREEKSRIACPSCNEPMYLAAVHCPHCKAKNPEVHDLSWLGQSKLDELTPNPEQHPNRLVQKQRCPVCATRLRPRRPRQACDACGHELFADPKQSDRYLGALDARLPEVLIISTLLSMIPVVGLIPGIIYYRVRLVSPLSRYTSISRSILTRWGIRLLFFVLIWVQLMPGVGAVVVPLMALISYTSYRAMFCRQLNKARGLDAPAEAACATA